MKQLTEAEKEIALDEHKESLKSMQEDVDILGKIIGEDNSAVVKMRHMYDIMASMTNEEVLALAVAFNEMDE